MKSIVAATLISAFAPLSYSSAGADPALPPSFGRPLEEAREQVNRDNEGPLGTEARIVCGRVIGVSDGDRMRTRRDVIQSGYDDAKADKFVQCVVDFMYPIAGQE